jgi:hypothetical protein
VRKAIALTVSPVVVALSLSLAAASAHSHAAGMANAAWGGRGRTPYDPFLTESRSFSRTAPTLLQHPDMGVPPSTKPPYISAYRDGRFPWLPEALFDGLDSSNTMLLIRGSANMLFSPTTPTPPATGWSMPCPCLAGGQPQPTPGMGRSNAAPVPLTPGLVVRPALAGAVSSDPRGRAKPSLRAMIVFETSGRTSPSTASGRAPRGSH